MAEVSRKLSQSNKQVLWFLLVGIANTAFSYGLYSLGLYLGLPYYLASLIALVLGIMLSFFTQGRLVFRARLKGRFGPFVAMWAGLYVVNITLIRLLAALGVTYYWAGLLALGPVTLLSFILQKNIVFPE